ncbi:haloacid dehalogenase-like hydrolase [Kitasatospora terrestris]|uniref:phosphoserine phosphatase n=1 Tax=Kitasatospora terrestris TaxID=258051 RepID=A0ABP9ET62_9ACTN
MKTKIAAIVLAGTVASTLSGCATTEAEASTSPCGRLDTDLAWYGDNASRLQTLLDRDGHCGKKGPHPVAVFDWDNTVVKNDVGDATTFWLLRHDKVRQPAGGDWTTTSSLLTPAAAAALASACGTAAPAGSALPTSTDTACADEILSVYSDARTTSGQDAFAGWNRRRTEPAYAWAAQLLAGYTPDEVKDFASRARQENLDAPVGAEQTVGTHRVTGWIRYYDQQKDLIRALGRSGFDVWITSASQEDVVQVWAAGVDLPADHVIGVRTRQENGKLTAALAGCGGDDDTIPYIDGKRCVINERILKVPSAKAFDIQPVNRRQAFAAGDSNTDVSFLRDATELRLVINRNKAELMCNAYDNADGKWIVNPMFISPKAALTKPYPCSTSAFTNPDGSSGPVTTDGGRVVPDQLDTVH